MGHVGSYLVCDRAIQLKRVNCTVFWRRLAVTVCFCKADELEWYRQQVSILWPSAYKAITISLSDSRESKDATDDVWDALPLSYTGIMCLLVPRLNEFLTGPPKNLLGLYTTGFQFFFAVALVGFELATIELLGMSSDHWAMAHVHCELLVTHGAKWI